MDETDPGILAALCDAYDDLAKEQLPSLQKMAKTLIAGCEPSEAVHENHADLTDNGNPIDQVENASDASRVFLPENAGDRLGSALQHTNVSND